MIDESRPAAPLTAKTRARETPPCNSPEERSPQARQTHHHQSAGEVVYEPQTKPQPGDRHGESIECSGATPARFGSTDDTS